MSTAPTLEAIRYARGSLQLLDQLKLPGETVFMDVADCDACWTMIRDMNVRGAPAIAIAAALALAVEAHKTRDALVASGAAAVAAFVKQKMDHLCTSRPTAVNLGEAVIRLKALADASVAEGLGSGFGTRAADFELLAVETRVAHAEAFVDAEAWGAGTGFEDVKKKEKGERAVADGDAVAVVPVALENLTYARRDAANGVRVAAFTERSRATPLLESGDAFTERYATRKRKTPFGSGPNAPLAARQARALRRGLGAGAATPRAATRRDEDGGSAPARLRDAPLARVRALTGSASPPEPEPESERIRSGSDVRGGERRTNGDASSKAPPRGFASEPGRRKRSLSLGSEAEWGASQLAHIEAVEAKALEARRSRKGAETQ